MRTCSGAMSSTYQFSPEAGRAVFYPRMLCPFTGSDRLEWRISKGLGTVYATTVVHPIEGKPFNVALIDCDEGFRLMSRARPLASVFQSASLRHYDAFSRAGAPRN